MGIVDEFKHKTFPNVLKNDLYLKLIDAVDKFFENREDVAYKIAALNNFEKSGNFFLDILSRIYAGIDKRPIIDGKPADNKQFIRYINKEISILKTGDSLGDLNRIVRQKSLMEEFGYDDYIIVIYDKLNVSNYISRYGNSPNTPQEYRRIPEYKFVDAWIYLYSSGGFKKSIKEFICHIDEILKISGFIGVQFMPHRVLANIGHYEYIKKTEGELNPIKYSAFPVPLGHSLIMSSEECEDKVDPLDRLGIHLKHRSYIILQDKDTVTNRNIDYYLAIKDQNTKEIYYLTVDNNYYKLHGWKITVEGNDGKYYLIIEDKGVKYYLTIAKKKTDNITHEIYRFLRESGFTMKTLEEEIRKLHDIVNRKNN